MTTQEPPWATMAPEVAELARCLVGAAECWGPTMTSDAGGVAFVSNRNGRPQLWTQAMPGPGAPPGATAVPFCDDPVLSVRWSPDGTWLACAVATGSGVRTQVWVVRPDGSDAHCVAGSPEQHATLGPWLREGHRLVVAVVGSGTAATTRCEIVDPASGERELLAEGGLLHVLDVSADGRLALLRDGRRGSEFCVVVDRREDQDRDLLPYPGTGSTPAGLLRPAPEGDAEALVAYLVTDAGCPRSELVAVPIAANGRRRESGTLARRDDGELEWLDADETGRLLVLSWNVSGRSEVELIDTRSGERRAVENLPGQVVAGCVMARDGHCVVLCLEGPSTPRSLWRLDTADLSRGRIDDCTFTTAAPLIEPTLEHVVAHDGLVLTGWLYRVADRAEPGPALITLHGGPEAQERPAFHPQHQVLVAAGIAVFAPNVRGSSGSGRAFVHADERFGRFDAIADVATCATFLVDAGVADTARLGVSGRSYGGYLTLAALATYPEVFVAGVDICGMSDLVSFFEHTETWIGAAAISKYGDPVADRLLLRALSPLRRAERIVAPVLVVHGELDTNVPVGEATQIVGALRALGRDVEYLQLDGEGHEYRRASSRLVLLEAVRRFLIERLAPAALLTSVLRRQPGV